MEQAVYQNEELACPYIVFKVRNNRYCINSRHVATIMQLPSFQVVPDVPAFVTGIFTHRDGVVQMLDLRTIFNIPSLNQEYKAFSDMLDVRKEDHVRWVAELDRTMKTGEKFSLATDPHQCAFGKWYDQFKTDNQTLRFHLNKIDEPHRLLHHAAHEMTECKQECDSCQRDECLKSIMTRVKDQYMPVVLRLLDEAKDIFHSTVYHEMVLVLSDVAAGIVVDEVLAVEELEDMGDQTSALHAVRYISAVKRSSKIPGIILELNEQSIRQLVKTE